VKAPFSPARAVKALGDELLARARLALDQHGEVARRDAFEQREGLAHRGARAEHAAEARARRDVVDGVLTRRNEPDRRFPQREQRLLRDHDLADAHVARERPVRRAEIDDEHSVGDEPQRQVLPRDTRIVDGDVARWRRADSDFVLREPMHLADVRLVRRVDHDHANLANASHERCGRFVEDLRRGRGARDGRGANRHWGVLARHVDIVGSSPA
jgi:hypothetical protein